MTYLALFVGWLFLDPVIPTGSDAQCIERGYYLVERSYRPYCIERRP